MQSDFKPADSPIVITLPSTGYIGQTFSITINATLEDKEHQPSWIIKQPEKITLYKKNEL